jgi:murein DD-endopeptidase MepM/ murein hydrolase activator NlpD
MKPWIKRAVAVWTAGALLVSGAGYLLKKNGQQPMDMKRVLAAGTGSVLKEESSYTDSRISAAEQKKQELEEEKQEVDKKLETIETFADDVQKYVKSLDTQVMNLEASMEYNKKQLKAMKEELETVTKEYETALEKQQEQYDRMKAHIKYIYENSRDSYLGYLIEAHNLADLLSREEYIEKVTGYDKTLLADYQDVLEELTAAKQTAEDKKDEMQATRRSLKYEKKTMEQLSEEKARQIEIYQGLADDTKQQSNAYATQIAQQESEIEALLKQKRDSITAKENAGETVQVLPVSGDYAWPLPVSGRISSTFGYRSAPTAGASTYHKGVDIAVDSGTKVLATKEGKVVTATYSSSAGNYVAIYHGGGLYSYYMHCSQLNVSVGDKVEQGQVIARSGSTGISTGPHLHFAVFKNGNYVNPMYYVKQPS